MKLSYGVRLFREIFFPRHCAVCEAEIDTGLVCASCRANFLLQKVKVYGSTKASWQEATAWGQPLVAEDYFDRVEYLYKYEGVFKDALHRLKFEAESEFLPLLREEAELALKPVVTKVLRHYDYVTTIPTSEERRRKRGFDVPSEVFGCLQELAPEKYKPQLLQRIKATAPLFSLGVVERREELAGCFQAVDSAQLQGKRVLLCDDIYTSGSTTIEAAGVLLRAGAKSVGVLTLCASKDNWD